MEGSEIVDQIITGRVEPKIYAFETDTVPSFLKVGDTYRPVHVRLREWAAHYEGIRWVYDHIAKVSDDTFYRDYAVHQYLKEHGFRRAEESDFGEGVYVSKEFFQGAKKRDVESAIVMAIDGKKRDDNIFSFLNYEKIKEGKMCRHIVMVLDTMIFLRGASSPQEYDQAIYRLQSQYVKTIKTEDKNVEEENKTVVYNMKPQTLLVDFDPTRMFVMQNRKSLICNINAYVRGNDELERRLEQELRFSPIIWLNHNKLRQVEAVDIFNAVRDYSRNKSIMDETFDIPVDDNIFNDDTLKDILKQQPEMSGSGNVFKTEPHKKEDDGDDVDTGDDAGEGKKDGKPTDSKPQNDELKSFRKRLQTFYFKTLLFAYLSDLEEKNLLVCQH